MSPSSATAGPATALWEALVCLHVTDLIVPYMGKPWWWGGGPTAGSASVFQNGVSS